MHTRVTADYLLPTHTYFNSPIHTQPIYSPNFNHICVIIEMIMHSNAPLCYLLPNHIYCNSPIHNHRLFSPILKIFPIWTGFYYLHGKDHIQGDQNWLFKDIIWVSNLIMLTISFAKARYKFTGQIVV